MNNLFKYTSVFAPFINDFIHEKELQGFKVIQLKWMLLEFDRFFTETSKKELFISSDDIREVLKIPFFKNYLKSGAV